ncbi:MAG TPA: hypothetical protein VIL55_02155 [Naasia sp.]
MEERLIRRTDLVERGQERPERRVGEGGDLLRLRRGVYADAGDWRNSSLDEQYSLRIAAAAMRLEGWPVFSHESAVRLLGLPSLRPWPETVHIITERSSGGRSQHGVVRHCLGLEAVDVVRPDGLSCTSPARTVLDIAVSRTFAEAVVLADNVVARYPGAPEDLEELLGFVGTRLRGYRKVRRVLAFADPRSESPGESWSRVVIRELGFAPPDLQAVVRADGRVLGRVDFEWTDAGVIGEFDGRAKYERAEFTAGRTPAEVVIEEKDREDRIRAVRNGFARWTWADLRDRRRLEAVLTAAGVPRSR